MKYRKYILEFEGDPEIVAFLAQHVKRQYRSLADMRAKARAAELLFGVKRKDASILMPRPERVKAL